MFTIFTSANLLEYRLCSHMSSVIVSGICIERNLHQMRSKRIFTYSFDQSDSRSCLRKQEGSIITALNLVEAVARQEIDVERNGSVANLNCSLNLCLV